MKLYIKLLNEDAQAPARAHSGDAGWDLRASHDTFISPASRKLVKTGVSLSFPEEYYARIAPRSGLAFKNGIDVLAGVCDSSYRGEYGVILHNTSTQTFFVKKGDKIAQVIFEKHENDVDPIVVDELPDSSRGEGGFGSTGS